MPLAEVPPATAEDARASAVPLRARADRELERAVVDLAPVLHKQALRLVRVPADASDLVQDTLERALRNSHSFRRGSNLRAWLLTIMTNLFIDRCRRRERETRLDPLEQDQLPAPAPETAPRWAELTTAKVRQAVNQLDPTFREPYLLHALERLSYQAVALRLQIPVATVGTRLIRARQRLRVLLEQQLDETPTQQSERRSR